MMWLDKLMCFFMTSPACRDLEVPLSNLTDVVPRHALEAPLPTINEPHSTEGGEQIISSHNSSRGHIVLYRLAGT
ncbi:hypothetical protein KIN20_034694 [Parelaphostrongylus tenuis]|uniref:Uncharacterized protein n=1 Tax=Parelaphostrongylus tenuis TaxID=148309 RepID=A0AAD5WK90_PARTN|nr:hypothetical protein KIN20_034694 [Parelaphostrongylus tenuis]